MRPGVCFRRIRVRLAVVYTGIDPLPDSFKVNPLADADGKLGQVGFFVQKAQGNVGPSTMPNPKMQKPLMKMEAKPALTQVRIVPSILFCSRSRPYKPGGRGARRTEQARDGKHRRSLDPARLLLRRIRRSCVGNRQAQELLPYRERPARGIFGLAVAHRGVRPAHLFPPHGRFPAGLCSCPHRFVHEDDL